MCIIVGLGIGEEDIGRILATKHANIALRDMGVDSIKFDVIRDAVAVKLNGKNWLNATNYS